MALTLDAINQITAQVLGRSVLDNLFRPSPLLSGLAAKKADGQYRLLKAESAVNPGQLMMNAQGAALGVAQQNIAAGQYGWAQISGLANVPVSEGLLSRLQAVEDEMDRQMMASAQPTPAAVEEEPRSYERQISFED